MIEVLAGEFDIAAKKGALYTPADQMEESGFVRRSDLAVWLGQGDSAAEARAMEKIRELHGVTQ